MYGSENGLRLQPQIEEQFNEASARVAEQDFRYPGMTYEEGVRDALAWVIMESDDEPMESDDE